MSETTTISHLSNGCQPPVPDAKQKEETATPLDSQPQAVNLEVANNQQHPVTNGSLNGKVDVGHPPSHTPVHKEEEIKKDDSNGSNKSAKHAKKKNRELSAIIDAITPGAVDHVTNGAAVENGDNHINGEGTNAKRRAPKRSNSTTSSSGDIEPRLGKRVRLQHQPFQSPASVITPFYRTHTSCPPSKESSEDKVVVFNKGEFLAVRNESGSFYVCRTAQNVYKTSRKFKIQWLNDDKDTYTPDFFDVTDFECVLTNLRMNRLSKGKFKLPPDEKQRVLNILQRALNVERGVADIPDPKQVVADGIDVSIVGKEDETEVVQLVTTLKKEETKQPNPTLTSNKARPRKSSDSSSKKSAATSNVVDKTSPTKKRKSSTASSSPGKEVPSKKIIKGVKKSAKKQKTKTIQQSDDETETEVSESEAHSDKAKPPAKAERNVKDNNKTRGGILRKALVAKEDLSKLAKKNQELRKTVEAKKALKNKVSKNPLTPVKACKPPPPPRSRLTRQTPESTEKKPNGKEAPAPSPSKVTRALKGEAKKPPVAKTPKDVPPPKSKQNKVVPIDSRKATVDVFQLIGFNFSPPIVARSEPVKTDKKSTLESAIRCGDSRTATECIKSGNESVETLSSLAFLAAAHCPQILPLLVSSGVDLNLLEPETGNSFLHVLASIVKKTLDLLSTTQHLLASGIVVNRPNIKGKLAIHIAAAVAYSEIDISFLEVLVDAGSNLSHRDAEGRIPLFYAFIKGSKIDESTYYDPVEQVILLSQGVNLDQLPDNNGETVLHRAASRGATVSCMHLLRVMANKDALDGRGNSPLAFSVLNGHESCTLALINAGCNFCLPVAKPIREVAASASGCKFLYNEVTKKKEGESTLLREIVEKNWQRTRIFAIRHIASLGYNLAFAVDALLQTKKLRFAVKLLSRSLLADVPDSKWLLHSLAQSTYAEDDPESQKKILDLLIERKLTDIFLTDSSRSTALVKAAENHNHVLCEELTTRMGIDKVATLPPNSQKHTPLTAMLLRLDKKDLSREMKAWAATLVSSGGTFNCLAYFPIQMTPFPTVRFVPNDGISASLSPLMVAVIKGNYAIVKYLLQQKADLNLRDEHGRTALMYAARLNDLKMLKLLLNPRYEPETDTNPWISRFLTFKQTSPADLSIRDNYGWTVVHHTVAPAAEYSYLTASVIIRLLAQVGAPLTAPDERGVTPHQMAYQRGLSTVVDSLQELIPSDESPPKVKVEHLLPFSSARREKKTVASLTDQLANSETEASEIFDLKSDPLLGFGDSSQIMIDEVNKVPFTALLIRPEKEDLGSLQFFKLQIVTHKDRNLLVFFTRWGRVGEVGQYKKTTCSTDKEAIDEFKKMFNTKTGLDWHSQTPQSSAQTPLSPALSNKYHFVKIDYNIASVTHDQSISTFVASLSSESLIKSSSLSPDIRDLLKDLLIKSLDSLKTPLVDLERNSYAFCKIVTFDNVAKARSLLATIKRLIEDKNDEMKSFTKKNSSAAPKVLKVLEQIIDINSEIHRLIPLLDKRLLLPSFDIDSWTKQKDLVEGLQKRLILHQIIASSHFRRDQANPFDFLYNCLPFHLHVLHEESFEGQLILRYVHRTTGITIKGIFSIPQDDHPANLTILNPWLLFSEVTNQDILPVLIGQQAAKVSDVLGEGHYFTDSLKKLAPAAGMRFVFISEVRLGNVQEVTLGERIESLPSVGFDSLKTKNAHWIPDASHGVIWNGRAIPLGSLVETETPSPFYNSYMVKDYSQVTLRYLVLFESSS